MPTYKLFKSALNIDRTVSGSHELLFGDQGYTGQINLFGSAYLQDLTSSGAAFAADVRVTGSNLVFGSQEISSNLTGRGFNSFKDLSATGFSFLKTITGESVLSGEFRVSGSLYVNGIQITGGGGSGTTIVSGAGGDYSTGNFTVSGFLYVNSGIFVTGNRPYLLVVSGNNSSQPVALISGSNPAFNSLRVLGNIELPDTNSSFFGRHRSRAGSSGLTVNVDPSLTTEMVFQDGLLVQVTQVTTTPPPTTTTPPPTTTTPSPTTTTPSP